MTPTQSNIDSVDIDSVDVSYPSPPDSPIIREPPKQRKKALISIQVESSAIPETIVYRAPIIKPKLKTPPPPVESIINERDNDDDESSMFEYDGVSDSGQSSASSDYKPSTKNIVIRRTRRIACRVCGKKFLRRDAFKQHQSRMHGLLPIVCEEDCCKERFATLSELFKHRLVHDPEARFPCQQCSRVFTTSHARKVHARIHIRRRSCKCDQCGMIFKAITHLHRHLRKEHLEKVNKTCPDGKSKSPAENPTTQTKSDTMNLEGRFRAIMPKPAPSMVSTKTSLPCLPLLKPGWVAGALPSVPASHSETNGVLKTIQEVVDIPSTQLPVSATTYLPIYPDRNVYPHLYAVQNGCGTDGSSNLQLYAFPDGTTEAALPQTVDAHSLFYAETAAALSYQLPDFGVENGDVEALQASFNGSFTPIEIVDLNNASTSTDLENTSMLDSFAASYSWPACDSLVYAAGESGAALQTTGISYLSYVAQPADGQAYAWLQPTVRNTEAEQSQAFGTSESDQAGCRGLTSFTPTMMLPSNT